MNVFRNVQFHINQLLLVYPAESVVLRLCGRIRGHEILPQYKRIHAITMEFEYAEHEHTMLM